MAGLESRIGCVISDAELKRRWAATRAAMDEAGIDALLVHGSNDYLGGYVKWFTDLPATTGYPTTLVFVAPGDIRFISQGRFGLDVRLEAGQSSVHRGVSRVLGAPGYASAHFTQRYEGEAVAKALTDFAHATIGIVGSSIPAALLDHLRAEYPGARFVQGADLVDPIKASKSSEEVVLIRQTAAMQDACVAAIRDAIRPGMRDIEVGGIAEKVGREHGSEQGIFLVASAPAGTPATYGIRHFQNRTIEAGDHVSVLVENSGSGGFYTEIGRTFVLGRADDALREAFALTVEAQQAAIARLAAGDSPATVWGHVNAMLAERGHAPETRLFCHGQGYDLVERPLIRFDEPMAIRGTANLACHPTVVTPRLFASCCDNFIVADGKAERIHATPQQIIEIA